MTELAKRSDFATDKPKQLREDLRRMWEEIYAAIVAEENRAPRRWRFVELPDGNVVRASRDDVIVGREGTVRPPGSPTVGDCFRVLHVESGVTISIAGDDGTPVQGALGGETLTVSTGWFEYTYAGTTGWWRQV
jgi:hypothetical protein